MKRKYISDDEHDELYPSDDIYDSLCQRCMEWRLVEEFPEEGGICEQCINQTEGVEDDS